MPKETLTLPMSVSIFIVFKLCRGKDVFFSAYARAIDIFNCKTREWKL